MRALLVRPGCLACSRARACSLPAAPANGLRERACLPAKGARRSRVGSTPNSLPEEYTTNGKLHFVVLSRLSTDDDTTTSLRDHLQEHEAWLKGLGARVSFHGPFLNVGAAYYGSEMYAVQAESAAEARQLVEKDPVHAKGIRKFDVLPWVEQTSW